MKRALVLIPLLLLSCGKRDVQPPADYELSGTLGGEWQPDARLRLALVGVGLPKVLTNNANLPQTPLRVGEPFGLDLPLPGLVGAYQVIAFDDRNNNATYDLGEPLARNRQWLIFSPNAGETPAFRVPENLPGAGEEAVPALTVARGWNLYDRATPLGSANPRPAGKVTGYDLTR